MSGKLVYRVASVIEEALGGYSTEGSFRRYFLVKNCKANEVFIFGILLGSPQV